MTSGKDVSRISPCVRVKVNHLSGVSFLEKCIKYSEVHKILEAFRVKVDEVHKILSKGICCQK